MPMLILYPFRRTILPICPTEGHDHRDLHHVTGSPEAHVVH
jgi:hypothetical protein